MLIFLAIVGIGFSAVLYNSVGTASSSNDRSKTTNAALAQAKDALIGRAASNANRPGSLPCPDIDNDGSAELYSGSDCPGYVPLSNVYIGRLPWRTLGLPDLRDANGERLWYAVSRHFARNPTCAPGCPVNSDSVGQLTITGMSPVSNAVAVVFAPEYTLASQNRTTAVQQNTVANYLDASNADGDATFTTGLPSDTFNDRLLVITTADVITVIEKRVARELLALLQNYRAASSVASFPSDPQTPCNCYTWADQDNNNEGDNDAFRGWLPLGEADPHDWSVAPPSPTGLGIVVPLWLHQNDWWKVIYYAVAPNETQNKTGGTLTVDGVPGTHVVLITPGPAAPGVPRPVNAPGTPAFWAEYLNDAENAAHNDNIYVRPSSTAYARNRLYTIP